MSMTDPLSDMLTRIRNGQKARLSSVNVTYSTLHENVLQVLKKEGYIVDFEKEEIRKGVNQIKVGLKYIGGRPAILEVKRLSRPGRRIYKKVSSTPKVYNGLGIAILSTPKGVMSDFEARVANVGGELLCSVF